MVKHTIKQQESCGGWKALGKAGLMGTVLMAVVLAAQVCWAIEPDWDIASPPDIYTSITTRIAGDVDGDGYSDLIVGYPAATPPDYVYDGTGIVKIIYGAQNGPGTGRTETVLIPEWSGDNFGASVSTAGDVNGDGYDDVLIGWPNYSYPEPENSGRAYVYYGGPSGLDTTHRWYFSGPAAQTLMGTKVAGLGDVDHDGFDDIMVAGRESDPVLIYGSSSGPGARQLTISWPYAPHSSNTFGPAGDLNADGIADFVLGEPRAYLASNNRGRVSLFLGHTGGVSGTPSEVLWQQPQADEFAGGLGSMVGMAGDVNGDGYGDLLVGSDDDGWINGGIIDRRGRFLIYPGDANGVSYTPIWSHYNPSPEGLYGYPEYGWIGDTAGDFNGDGFSDIVLASPYHDNLDDSEYQSGLIQIFFGGRGGPDASVSEQYVGPDHTESGVGTACAGDLNGDGYGDVVFTGERGTDLMGFAGRGNDLDRLRQWQLASTGYGAFRGKDVAVLGDINGDGLSDAAVSAPNYLDGRGQVQVFLGTEFGLASTAQFSTSAAVGSHFGDGLSRAGDLNGDGYEDLLVGAPGVNGHGAVYGYFGSASGFSSPADWAVEGSQDLEDFGSEVLGGFDCNGDGYADVLVGSPNYTNNNQYEGLCRLYLGGPSGPQAVPVWQFESNDWMSFTGGKLSAAGDVNRDGYADVLIGAPGHRTPSNPGGRVYLFLGTAGGLQSAPAWQKDAANEYDDFGSGLGYSDLNRDGYSDVIIGVSGYGTTGRIEVYRWNGDDSLESAPFYYIYGPVPGDFGEAVSGAGDVNGDGYGDAIIGAPGINKAYLLLGGFSHVQNTSSFIHLSDWASSDGDYTDADNDYAASVSGGGDFNGDGFADVLVGDPGYHLNGPDQGIAYTYLGNGLNELGGRVVNMRQNYGVPIPLKGRSPSASTFYLNAQGFSPYGRTDVRMVYRIVPTGSDPRDGSVQTTDWINTGNAGSNPSIVGLAAIVGGLEFDTGYQWQARVESDNLCFPRSPWRTCSAATPFEMHLKTAGPPPQPDLTVTLVTPDMADGGSPTTMTATVANYGLTTAGASQARVLLNGSEVCGSIAVPSLAASATYQFSCNLGYLPGGNNVVTVQVDTGNAVTEADENNNTLEHIIATTNYYTIYLQADGSGTFPTIQEALDAVNPGGTISLGDGTYAGAGNRDLVLQGKTVTVKSGSNNAEACTLDAWDAGPGLLGHFAVAAGETLSLQGVTLTRGTQEYGGAVHVEGAFLPTNVTFIGNESNEGGAIDGLPDSFIRATDCRFLSNTSSEDGGAVNLNQDYAWFIGSVFDGNYTHSGGGAVRVYGATANFRECQLTANISDNHGGAVSIERQGSDANLDHCTLVGNSADCGGHLFLADRAIAGCEWSIFANAQGGGAIDHAEAEYSTLECCDVYGNTGGDFINLWADYANGNEGCFSADPLFCDSASGSYSLQAESPCATGGCGLVGAYPVGCGLIYTVAPDGSGDFATIQSAVDGVQDGSIIELLDGQFTDQGNSDVTMDGRQLTIRSQSGDSTACIIDVRGTATENHRAFNLTGGTTLTLQGVTLRRGYMPHGSAIYLVAGSSLHLERVVVADNVSETGAVYVLYATEVTIHRCTFSDNAATSDGAAVGLYNSPAVITSCNFRSNQADNYGGAVYGSEGSMLDMQDCLVRGGIGYGLGGGIYLESSGTLGTVSNCTFWGTEAPNGSSVASVDAAHTVIERCIMANGEGSAVYTGEPGNNDGTAEISCCDVYWNTGGDWVEALAGLEGVGGNFSAEAQFCDPDHLSVFTLQAGSPCLPGGNVCNVVIGAFGEGCEGVSDALESPIPRQSYLAANVPNPFNPQTEISFGLAETARTTLAIYDLAGRRVRTLVAGEQLPAGIHHYVWNGRDDTGRQSATGTYFYRIQSGAFSDVHKMTLLK